MTFDLHINLSLSPLPVVFWNTVRDAVTATKASGSALVLKGHPYLFKVSFQLYGETFSTWLSELYPKVKKDEGRSIWKGK